MNTKDEYKRIPATYEELPIDGVLELYFRNVPEMERAFTSPEGKKLSEYSKTIVYRGAQQLINQYHIFKK